MPESTDQSKPKPPDKRKAALAEALRANLLKRKAAARAKVESECKPKS